MYSWSSLLHHLPCRPWFFSNVTREAWSRPVSSNVESPGGILKLIQRSHPLPGNLIRCLFFTISPGNSHVQLGQTHLSPRTSLSPTHAENWAPPQGRWPCSWSELGSDPALPIAPSWWPCCSYMDPPSEAESFPSVCLLFCLVSWDLTLWGTASASEQTLSFPSKQEEQVIGGTTTDKHKTSNTACWFHVRELLTS